MKVLSCGLKASNIWRISDAISPRYIRKNPRSMYARVPHGMGQFVLKIEKLSHIMGTAPILEMARPYGLRPRLWLLYVFNNRIVATSLLWLSQNTVYITFPHSQKLMHCRIGLPLPIHTIKCTVITPLLKVKWVVSSFRKLCRCPLLFSCYFPSKLNIDVSRSCFARALCHLQLNFSMIFTTDTIKDSFSAGSRSQLVLSDILLFW